MKDKSKIQDTKEMATIVKYNKFVLDLFTEFTEW